MPDRLRIQIRTKDNRVHKNVYLVKEDGTEEAIPYVESVTIDTITQQTLIPRATLVVRVHDLDIEAERLDA